MVRPDFLTVEEAAQVLRIGRTSAYLAAKRYRDTGGAEGLPVVAIRGSLRVPRRQLEAMAGGPIDASDLAVPVTSVDEHGGSDRPPTTTAAVMPTPKPKRKASNASQRSLPFSP